MTDLTSRELFDAIERSLRRTGRRFARPAISTAKKAAKAPARAAKTKAPSRKSKQRPVRRRNRAGALRT
jgi:hypothetical protein